MEIIVLKSFNDDIKSIRNRRILRQVERKLDKIYDADNLDHVTGITKLTGFKNAYRLRSGD